MIRRCIPLLMLVLALALCVPAAAAVVDRGSAELELAQAMTAMQAAERDDAARYAPADYDEAGAMLDAARQASARGAWTELATYAERAKVAADLASAKARRQRAEAATAEIQRSVDTLRAQLGPGGQP
jgi:hypothetical protein